MDPEPATFGIVPGSFAVDFLKGGGSTPAREAGTHPGLATVAFDFNSVTPDPIGYPGQKAPAGNVRQLEVDLPPGFVGNPTAVAECTPAQLTVASCPASSQVGRVDGHLYPAAVGGSYGAVSLPVFNMSNPRGAVADLAFQQGGNPIHLRATLDPARGYAVRMTAANINETAPPFDLRLTLWGNPAAHEHDSERCGAAMIEVGQECAVGTPKPFLTLPSTCGVDQESALLNYDSWQHSGIFGPELSYAMPGQLTGCEVPRFEPEVEAVPTGHRADTPTGLDFHFELPQSEDPDTPGTPPAKRIEITLPRGMSISAAAADGLSACSPAEIGLGSNDPVTCPDSSRLGTATLSTSLLPNPLEGYMYLASQGDNPFHSLLAAYLVVRDSEERGILIKIPGRLDLDSVTGQVVATFDDLPQFPIEDLRFGFRSGERAPLVNPAVCGPQAIGVQIASYAQPDAPVGLPGTYEVSEAAGAGPCPQSLAARPFAPRTKAGTVTPDAAASTPFIFRLSREDGDQELGGMAIDLPPGLVAGLAGIPLCTDSAISASSSHAVAETGGSELDHPSCPPESAIGTATVSAGAGSAPIYLSGRVYLAGPYRGAPFSLVAVVPALAGPLDLGTVVTRMAVYINPATAQLRVVSDPLPAILSGIPLHLRQLQIDLNRAGLFRNPTSCDEEWVHGSVTSQQGTVAPVSNRFQVGNCASLKFRPAASVRLLGPTHRGGHPKLRLVVAPRPGDANIRRVGVTLPGTELLDNRHVGATCTPAQFATQTCPADSIYGFARAWTPLLSGPLEGPVYLRASATRLPELAASLGGEDPPRLERPGRLGAGAPPQHPAGPARCPAEQGCPDHARWQARPARQHGGRLRREAARRDWPRCAQRQGGARRTGREDGLRATVIRDGNVPLAASI